MMTDFSYRTGVLAALLTIGLASTASAQTKRAGHPAAAKAAPKTAAEAPAAQAPVPTPIGDPASWVSIADYPAAASAAGQEGRTAFALDVDAQGRVTGCRIVESSGSPLLDNTTCSAMIVNARFKAARGEDGRAVAGIWRSAMQWKLANVQSADE